MLKIYRVAAAAVSLPVLLALLALLAGQPAHGAADAAWTRDATSAGLSRSAPTRSSVHRPPTQVQLPAGARVSAVYASRQHAAGALVASQLCFGSPAGPCVPLEGRSITTHAFDGLPAAGPFLLVHRLLGRSAVPAPVFVRGTVTVWYANGARPAVR